MSIPIESLHYAHSKFAMAALRMHGVLWSRGQAVASTLTRSSTLPRVARGSHYAPLLCLGPGIDFNFLAAHFCVQILMPASKFL